MAKSDSSQNTGMLLVTTFFVLLVVNSVVVYLANSFFPNLMELGTAELSPFFALVLSMGILSLVGPFAIPFVRLYEESAGRMPKSSEWMGVY